MNTTSGANQENICPNIWQMSDSNFPLSTKQSNHRNVGISPLINMDKSSLMNRDNHDLLISRKHKPRTKTFVDDGKFDEVSGVFLSMAASDNPRYRRIRNIASPRESFHFGDSLSKQLRIESCDSSEFSSPLLQSKTGQFASPSNSQHRLSKNEVMEVNDGSDCKTEITEVLKRKHSSSYEENKADAHEVKRSNNKEKTSRDLLPQIEQTIFGELRIKKDSVEFAIENWINLQARLKHFHNLVKMGTFYHFLLCLIILKESKARQAMEEELRKLNFGHQRLKLYLRNTSPKLETVPLRPVFDPNLSNH